MKRLIKTSIIALAAAIALFFSISAAAEDSGWNHTATLFLWGSGLDGSVGMGPTDVDVDASFSDLLNNLDMAFMAKYRAKKEVWAINAELMYVGLEGTGSVGPVTGTASLDQTIVELSGGYEVQSGLDILAGVRYVKIETDMSSNLPLLNRSRSDSWVDPIIGMEYRAPLSDKWSFYGRGDIGGFGIGSELSWQLGATFNYQISERWYANLGYRILDIDYDNGKSGSDRYIYDLRQSGPVLGISAKF